MDNNSIRATIMGAAALALAFGIIVVQRLRFRSQIVHESYINQDYEIASYINNILYEGDQKCIDQIRMQPIAFFF